MFRAPKDECNDGREVGGCCQKEAPVARHKFCSVQQLKCKFLQEGALRCVHATTEGLIAMSRSRDFKQGGPKHVWDGHVPLISCVHMLHFERPSAPDVPNGGCFPSGVEWGSVFGALGRISHHLMGLEYGIYASTG